MCCDCSSLVLLYVNVMHSHKLLAIEKVNVDEIISGHECLLESPSLRYRSCNINDRYLITYKLCLCLIDQVIYI